MVEARRLYCLEAVQAFGKMYCANTNYCTMQDLANGISFEAEPPVYPCRLLNDKGLEKIGHERLIIIPSEIEIKVLN